MGHHGRTGEAVISEAPRYQPPLRVVGQIACSDADGSIGRTCCAPFKITVKDTGAACDGPVKAAMPVNIWRHPDARLNVSFVFSP